MLEVYRILKSFNLFFSFRDMYENNSVSLLISLDYDSSSRVTPKSCSKATTCNFNLKNIYSVLILKRRYNLSALSALTSRRLFS